MHAVERERQSRSAQKKQHNLKKESVIKKKHAAIQVISKKYQDVEHVKTESKRLKAERERLQLLQVERARAKRQAIRKQEDALKKKKMLDRQQVDEEAALRLMKKAIAEERQIREHHLRVQEMEEAERALIQRLQGTQLIQREAYSVLEQALLRTDLKRAHSVAPLGDR
ncbi:unnamed protein product [Phytophthora lilii]|uniref:Unnamed protein product n=1 Tax=Phytophthora lilii TaxID=2077276 RepID=A0A9W6XDX8_9STRA|nr:unnamed protein product [Phytophthora lilii]